MTIFYLWTIHKLSMTYILYKASHDNLLPQETNESFEIDSSDLDMGQHYLLYINDSGDGG